MSKQTEEASLADILAALRDSGKERSVAADAGGEGSDGFAACCAVCRLAERSVDRALRTFFSEFVNDPALRLRFRRSRGFCRVHTPLVARCGDALGVAIVCADIADSTVERWRTAPRPAGRSPLSRWLSAPDAPCPACAAEAEAEARYSGALATALRRCDEAWSALEASSGMCAIHVERIAALSDAESAARLISIERAKMDALTHELQEFVRKNDYRFRGEPWGAERDSWRRALWRLRR